MRSTPAIGCDPHLGRTASPSTIDQVGLFASRRRRETMLDMTSAQPQPKLTQVVTAALAKGTAHDRQRELVRASLLCR
jgi:hypothetical protein